MTNSSAFDNNNNMEQGNGNVIFSATTVEDSSAAASMNQNTSTNTTSSSNHYNNIIPTHVNNETTTFSKPRQSPNTTSPESDSEQDEAGQDDMLMDAFGDSDASDLDDEDWDDRRIEHDTPRLVNGGGIRSFFKKPEKQYVPLKASNSGNSQAGAASSSGGSSSSSSHMPSSAIQTQPESIPLQDLRHERRASLGEDDDPSSSSHLLLPSEQPLGPTSSASSRPQPSPSSPNPSTSTPSTTPSASTSTTSPGGGFFSRGIFSGWRSRQPAPSLTAANQNDGVFNNMNAKPETASASSGDVPPSYEEAAADAAPLYWETTIMSPGYGDEVFIDGLPVGSPINFIWNMMVSCAFQFVGFLLTYLLHTSHAAKQGARAGLGFTLFQYGFYLQPSSSSGSNSSGGNGSGGTHPGNTKHFEPNNPNDYNVGSNRDSISGSFHHLTGIASTITSKISSSITSNNNNNNAASSSTSSKPATDADKNSASGWMSVVLMTLGILIIAKAVFDYIRARKMELVISQGPSNVVVVPLDPEEAENMV